MTDRYRRSEPTTIVLVSRSPDLERLVEAAVDDEYPIDVHVHGAIDDALAFLERREPYADAPRASLVLLDDRHVDALAFLERSRDEPGLARIPVVVFGEPSPGRDRSDTAASDVVPYYDRHANAYVPVPGDEEGIGDLLGRLATFWVATARLPNREDRRS